MTLFGTFNFFLNNKRLINLYKINRGRHMLYTLDVVAGESSERAGTVARSDKPAVVTFFQDVNGVSFQKLQFVVVLWPILVKCFVSAKKECN